MTNENRTDNERVERASCPEDVLRMIAWYDDEALGSDERANIEAHAAECAACRSELEWIQGSDDGDVVAAAPPADAMYARVREQIEETQSDDARPASDAPRRAVATTRFEWRQLALAASVVIALVGAFVAGQSLAPPDYVAATAPAAASGDSPFLDVIFAPETTATQINDALRAIGGTIVEGPSRLGVYRVQLKADADAVAAARLLRGAEDGDGVASLAEVGGA